MTTRERWLVFGLVIVTALFLGVGLWQRVRYSDAENAAEQFVQLEEKISHSHEDQEVLAKQAQPEVRRLLSRGDFLGVLKRLDALRQEDHGDDPEIRGKQLAVDQLWPKSSKERTDARALLLEVVKKQGEGYDVAATQEALLRVAEAARAGKKDAALAAFASAKASLEGAQLRPGFKASVTQAASPAGGPVPAPGGPNNLPYTPEQKKLIMGVLQGLRTLPQMAQNPNLEPEKRAFLQRLQVFGDQFQAALSQRKDVRPVLPLLVKMWQSFTQNKQDDAVRALGQAEAQVRALPTLPPGQNGPGGKPSAPAGGPPGGPAPVSPPPVLPPVPGGPNEALTGERLLAVLDSIRKIPEPVYQSKRAQMAAAIGQMLQARAASPTSPTAQGIGDPKQVRLEIGAQGEIQGVKLAERDLSTGEIPGGIRIAFPGAPDLDVKVPVKPVASGFLQQVESPNGGLKTTFEKDGNGVRLRIEGRKAVSKAPGELVVRIPARLAGWKWEGTGDPQVIAVDGTYSIAPPADEQPARAVIRGAGRGLQLEATGAASIDYQPSDEMLRVRFSLPAEAGSHRFSISLQPAAPRL